MKRNKQTPLAGDLVTLADQFAAWRSQRPLGTPIPEHLWNSATSLALEHGACLVARTLSLDYARLKRRMAEHEADVSDACDAPHFVEIPREYSEDWTDDAAADKVESLAEIPDVLGSQGIYLELSRSDGALFRAWLPPGEPKVLRDLAADFWRQAS